MSSKHVNQQTDGDDGGRRNSNRKKRSGYGKKAKRMVLSRIRKAKKEADRNESKVNRSSISRSSGRSCLCIKRIPSLGSITESPTSDPNSSEFTFDSLRALLEKSDFFSNECNTHLDLPSSDD